VKAPALFIGRRRGQRRTGGAHRILLKASG
jgi:hypothetical protein